ncbi:purine nucleosidase [Paenibacillus algorifonticola]|uniref:Purine nucleosidase n=1 Tax=Paenibacillus algorifonticola TaxID=684063 RepID=A0A1I2HVV5_9BACL|nr:nucleoside hydrolase [Paenibacillus algorifonticola]SFF33972.1 purine nucleosidase [Paenibacillus algorifonticola]
MKKIMLDVDTGIDDALGILLALRCGEVELLGISTVNGNVSVDTATANTCKILDLAKNNTVPVIRGAHAPLMRKPVFEHRVHGQDGLGGALKEVIPSTERIRKDSFGPDFLIEQVQKYPGEITLVATGPLTNVALAISKYPAIVHELKELVIMGGVVRGFGNVTPTAEYNMFVDPEAAKLVLGAGFPKLRLVGLDVTRRALLTDEHIRSMGDSPLAEYVAASTADYMLRYYERNGVQACAMHDPLAVAAAIWPKLLTSERYYVDVETKSELCDGQTVCDFQNRLQRAPNVDVCLEVDAEQFLARFVNALSQTEQ